MKPLLDQEFLFVHLDPRQKHGRDLIQQVRGDRRGGIPWIAIQDARGNELTTSDGPKGNVGCPVQPHEVTWFMTMLTRTATHLDWAALKHLESELEAFAQQYRTPRRGDH